MFITIGRNLYPPYLHCRVAKLGNVFRALALHMLLWTVPLLENAAAASNAAIFQHIWLPENNTYIDLVVSVDVTTPCI